MEHIREAVWAFVEIHPVAVGLLALVLWRAVIEMDPRRDR